MDFVITDSANKNSACEIRK